MVVFIVMSKTMFMFEEMKLRQCPIHHGQKQSKTANNFNVWNRAITSKQDRSHDTSTTYPKGLQKQG
jgi:hypothetical protein